MSEPASELERVLAPGRWGLLGLALVLAVCLGLALTSAARKSITVDELGHLPSGLHFLQTGDPRHASLNPPLVNALSALPVLFLDLSQAPTPPPATDDVFSFWTSGYRFMERHREDYLRIYDAARVVPVLMLAGLGVLLFFWGRRLAPEAPDAAGLLAAGLVCFSPNMLAHARIVGTDVGAALFVALALFAFRRMLLRPNAANVVLCGLMLGLAQLTKLYALLLYPAFAIVTPLWCALSPTQGPGLRRLAACTGGAMLLSVFVLNSGHLWSEFGASLSQIRIQSEALGEWQPGALGRIPLPLPAAYVRGLDGQLMEVGSGIPSYLLGESFQGGRWYYYLGVLAIKTPLPLLLVFTLALAFSFRHSSLEPRERVLLLAYPLLLFVLLSLGGRRQLGGRALLSAVPLLQLWVAATLVRARPGRWPRVFAAAATLSTLWIALASHPDYLSYFNAFVGGKERGYRVASDANVDIGQDLVQLSEYLEAVGEEKVQLLYFGSVDPALYGIDYEVPAGFQLRPGRFAVSVTLYRMGYPVYDHGTLRPLGPVDVDALGEPEASIGGSIHVYRVPQPEGDAR